MASIIHYMAILNEDPSFSWADHAKCNSPASLHMPSKTSGSPSFYQLVDALAENWESKPILRVGVATIGRCIARLPVGSRTVSCFATENAKEQVVCAPSRSPQSVSIWIVWWVAIRRMLRPQGGRTLHNFGKAKTSEPPADKDKATARHSQADRNRAAHLRAALKGPDFCCGVRHTSFVHHPSS